MHQASSTLTRLHGILAEKVILERDPSLLNLPVPIPSVPVLTPIIDPLVSGKKKPLAPPQPAPPSNPPPPPPPTTPDPTTPNNPPPSPTPTGDGDTKPPPTQPENPPSNPQQPPSNPQTPPSDPQTPPSDPQTPPANPQNPTSDPQNPSTPPGNDTPENGDGNNGGGNQPPVNTPSGTDPGSGGATPSGSNSLPGTSQRPDGPIHAGNNLATEPPQGESQDGDGENSSVGFGHGGTTPVAGGNNGDGEIPASGGSLPSSPSHSNNPGSSPGIVGGSSTTGGNGGIGGGNGTDSPAGASTSKGGLSTGGIVAIAVVLGIFFICLFVFFLRRRYKSTRQKRRDDWWRGYSNNQLPDGLTASPSPPPVRSSFRSSFGTNFDQGAFPGSLWTVASVPDMPELPPTAEVRQGQSPTYNTPLITAYTVGSPRPSSQEIANGAGTPRANSRLSRNTSMTSRSSTTESGAQYLTAPSQITVSAGGTLLTPMSVRPFSPSESFAFPKPPQPNGADTTDASFVSSTSTIDPFADPTSQPIFLEREIIKRPFIPTLSDELAVSSGDVVRIMQTYDDGWSFVQKIYGEENIVTGAGLIPIDCLREVDEELPAFLASKRVSSYHGQVQLNFDAYKSG